MSWDFSTDPQFQELAASGTDEIISTRLEPGADPIMEAQRRGSILLVIRMGNVDQEAPNTPPLDSVGQGNPMQCMMPPGMMPPGMPFTSRSHVLGAHAKLLIYSDGVFEIERPDGTMWQFPEFVEYVSGLLPKDESVIEPLLARVREIRGGDLLADDFSLLEVRL